MLRRIAVLAAIVTAPLAAQNPSAPGWFSVGKAGSKSAGVDSTVAFAGSASGYVMVSDSQWSGHGQMIRADDFLGKRVRLSAMLRTRNVSATGGGAGLWMRVDAKGGESAFDNMFTRGIRGTTEWTRVSVVLDVSPEASGIAFGMLLLSRGEAWVDDFTFESVGTDVPSTNTLPQPHEDPTRLRMQRLQYERLAAKPINLGFERRW